MIGSEAMVGNGGFKYKSPEAFILFNSIQIVISLIAIFLLFKLKGTNAILLSTLLLLLQLLLFVTM
jgi:hypothetical protein